MKSGITSKDILNDILNRSEFVQHKNVINIMEGPAAEMMANMSIQQLAQLVGDWNADNVAEGLDYLSEQCRSGNKFYDIWTETDIQTDTSKKGTTLVAYPIKNKSKFVLLCAGGAYMAVSSMVEAFPVAKRINELGYSAFVLKYRTGEHALAPNPMEDIAQAVRFILNHAEEFNVDTEDYAVAGFSAGGHLVASFGTDSIGYQNYGLPKPGALILAYPVITMMEKAHPGSRDNLLGKENINNQELLRKYSIEQQVTANYPPSFVWQCDQDKEVPIDNSQMMVKALKEKGIACEYETFPSDAHGWGEGKGTSAEGWIERAIDFWQKNIES